MTPGVVIELLQRTLATILTVGGPLLLAALVVGVAVSLLQAVTQVQEQTLTFIPKLVVVALVFAVTLPWMLRSMVSFTAQLLRGLPGYGQ